MSVNEHERQTEIERASERGKHSAAVMTPLPWV